MNNYGKLQDCEDLPEGLRGEQRQQLLLGNISEILELHEQEILPLMLRNQRDLKGLFDEFAAHFEVRIKKRGLPSVANVFTIIEKNRQVH